MPTAKPRPRTSHSPRSRHLGPQAIVVGPAVDARSCCGCADDDVEIDAGIDDVEVEVEQEQEDIDQKNEAEQKGLWNEETGYWGPAVASPRPILVR